MVVLPVVVVVVMMVVVVVPDQAREMGVPISMTNA